MGTVLTQQSDTASILNVYRKFSRARNTYPALASGTMTEHPLYNDKAFSAYPQLAAWYLTGGGEKMLVLHNLGKDQVTFSLDDPLDYAAATLGNVYIQEEKEGYKVKMDAYSSVVFVLK